LMLDELWLALPYNQCITPQNKKSIEMLLNLSNAATNVSESWIQEVRYCLTQHSVNQHLTNYEGGHVQGNSQK
jgi:hypothetical protein